MDDRESKLTYLKEIIASGNTELAIDEFILYIKDRRVHKNIYNSIILLSNQYNNIKQRELLNLPFDQSDKNKVILSILTLVDKLNESESLNNDNSYELRSIRFLTMSKWKYHNFVRMNFFMIGIFIILCTLVFGIIVGIILTILLLPSLIDITEKE